MDAGSWLAGGDCYELDECGNNSAVYVKKFYKKKASRKQEALKEIRIFYSITFTPFTVIVTSFLGSLMLSISSLLFPASSA